MTADQHIPARVAFGWFGQFRGLTARNQFDPWQWLGLLQICVQPLGGVAVLNMLE